MPIRAACAARRYDPVLQPGGDLADGNREPARLRPEPLFDSGSLSDLRHRRQPCGAKHQHSWHPRCTTGARKLAPPRRTFRLLFIPGSVALLCDVVGFSTLMVIDIGVIRATGDRRERRCLRRSSSPRCFCFPVLMSYAGVFRPACLRKARSARPTAITRLRARFPRVHRAAYCTTVAVVALVILGAGHGTSAAGT